MSQQTAEDTRRSLHGVAELVLAGPQYAASQTIRLCVTPGGFGTVATPQVRVEGLELGQPVVEACAGRDVRRPRLGGRGRGKSLAGPVRRWARHRRRPGRGRPTGGRGDPRRVRTWRRSDALLPPASRARPEHFDVGISLAEVNTASPPATPMCEEPYAYVGPWSPRQGTFWNTAFGAARPLTDLPNVDTLVEFPRGARRAGSDPPARQD